MSQGVVFYDNDTFIVPFFIYEGINKYTVSFDITTTKEKNETNSSFPIYGDVKAPFQACFHLTA